MSDLKITHLNFSGFCLIFLIPVLFLASCKPDQGKIDYSGSTAIEIATDSISEEADVSSYINRIDVKPLKETSGNIVGDIYKLLKTDSNYILFDRFNSKRVVVFNNSGNFVAKLADVGRSLRDPVQINDCWKTPSNGVGIYDFSSKKIYIYDANFKLDLVMQSPYDRIFSSLSNMSDGSYVGYKGYTGYNAVRDGESYKLAYLKSDLSLKTTYLSYNRALNDALISNTSSPLQDAGGETVVVEEYSGSVLGINENGARERYNIRYSKHQLPQDYLQTIIAPNAKLFKAKQPDFKKINMLFLGYCGFSGNWKETRGLVIIESFDKKSRLFYSIYDKASKRIVASAYTLLDKRTNTILPPFAATGYSKNEFVAIYPGYALKYAVRQTSSLYPIISKNLENNYIFYAKFR